MSNRKNIVLTLISIMLLSAIYAGNASALGIAPSKKIIEYSTAEQTISGRIINNDGRDMTVRISATGEFSEYVTVNTPTLEIKSHEAEKDFTYTVMLPSDITPGPKTINIVAAETAGNTENSIGGMLSITQQLIIQVPYTGKYLEGFVLISATDPGAPIESTVTLVNRGTENTERISGNLNVEDVQGNIIYSEALDSDAIPSGGMNRIINIFRLDEPGSYIMKYNILYGGKNLGLSKEFGIGKYSLILEDANVKNFRLGTVAKFDISVSTNWNGPIDDVRGEVIITDKNDSIIGRTDITEASIDPDGGMITAYWDTSYVQTGEYIVKVKLFAGSEVVTKEYFSTIQEDKILIETDKETEDVKISGSGIDWKYIVLALILLAVIIKIISLAGRRNKKLYK